MNILKNNIIKTILYWLPSIIFNILETAIILLIAKIIGLSIYRIVYTICVFQVTRHLLKQDKHYKSPFKCFIWSTIIFTLIFLVAKIDIISSTIATILGAYVLSGKADVNKQEGKEESKNVGMYLWKQRGEPSKYKFIEDYVKENKDTEQIKEFEMFLSKKNNEYYKIYKLRFYDGKSQKYIVDKMQISSTARLTEKLDEIQSILQLYLEFNQRELVKKN